ncbi:hypothetical protein GF327_05405 [Candidatus Woesearchaeota archaeon]|nr:hypothetical protein [Candidatus Woesearchaeota archaeon]
MEWIKLRNYEKILRWKIFPLQVYQYYGDRMGYPRTSGIDSFYNLSHIGEIQKSLQEKKQAYKKLGFYVTSEKLIWIRLKHGKFWSYLDIDKKREEIKTELIEPLFERDREINIKFESAIERHKKDNLFCCMENARKKLDKIYKDGIFEKFIPTIEELKSNCDQIAPEAFNPFKLFLDPGKENLKNPQWHKIKYKELKEERNKIADKLADLYDDHEQIKRQKRTSNANDNKIANIEKNIKILKEKYSQLSDQIDEQDINCYLSDITHSDIDEAAKVKLALKLVEINLNTLKFTRMKPGRSPKRFNVFVYHLINKFTKWKRDENRKYLFHSNGKHKLERDWDLIVFLLIDSYIQFPRYFAEMNAFFEKNKNKPAKDAIKVLKVKLRDIYRNFPDKKDGSEFSKYPLKAGYKKLTINNGKIEVTWL